MPDVGVCWAPYCFSSFGFVPDAKGHDHTKMHCELIIPCKNEDRQPAGTQMVYSIIAAAMIVNTKHVPMKTSPAMKLFKGIKRDTATFTRIDTKAYTTALNSTGGQDKKRPHIRRGHIRTYDSGLQIWVNDMLVGFKTEGQTTNHFIEREKYTVNSPLNVNGKLTQDVGATHVDDDSESDGSTSTKSVKGQGVSQSTAPKASLLKRKLDEMVFLLKGKFS